ncbi:MAG: hypothetical protein V4659_13280 [Pseudomonadota bacterium]
MIRVPTPLHGWRIFWGEVGVIVLGVLIALGAQQVAEAIDWRQKARAARDALDVELRDNYGQAIEAIMVAPCVDRQLADLATGLTAPVRVVAPTMSDRTNDRYVYRVPSREWSNQVWRSAVGDGIVAHLDAPFAQAMREHYTQLEGLVIYSLQTDEVGWRLRVLAQPGPIDPATRGVLLQDIETARGLAAFTATVAKQVARRLSERGVIDAGAPLSRYLPRSGTIDFCRARGLPLGTVDPSFPMS